MSRHYRRPAALRTRRRDEVRAPVPGLRPFNAHVGAAAATHANLIRRRLPGSDCLPSCADRALAISDP